MLQRYSVRLQIHSWFMKYCHPKLASAGVIAGDVGRRQQSSERRRIIPKRNKRLGIAVGSWGRRWRLDQRRRRHAPRWILTLSRTTRSGGALVEGGGGGGGGGGGPP